MASFGLPLRRTAYPALLTLFSTAAGLFPNEPTECMTSDAIFHWPGILNKYKMLREIRPYPLSGSFGSTPYWIVLQRRPNCRSDG